jgi:tetratricopeptide (TPR) repeat protein
LREQGKYDEAIEKYEKALKIDPSNLIVYLNLGTVLCYIKKYDEAIEIFKIVTKIDHNDTNSYIN